MSSSSSASTSTPSAIATLCAFPSMLAARSFDALHLGLRRFSSSETDAFNLKSGPKSRAFETIWDVALASSGDKILVLRGIRHPRAAHISILIHMYLRDSPLSSSAFSKSSMPHGGLQSTHPATTLLIQCSAAAVFAHVAALWGMDNTRYKERRRRQPQMESALAFARIDHGLPNLVLSLHNAFFRIRCRPGIPIHSTRSVESPCNPSLLRAISASCCDPVEECAVCASSSSSLFPKRRTLSCEMLSVGINNRKLLLQSNLCTSGLACSLFMCLSTSLFTDQRELVSGSLIHQQADHDLCATCRALSFEVVQCGALLFIASKASFLRWKARKALDSSASVAPDSVLVSASLAALEALARGDAERRWALTRAGDDGYDNRLGAGVRCESRIRLKAILMCSLARYPTYIVDSRVSVSVPPDLPRFTCPNPYLSTALVPIPLDQFFLSYSSPMRYVYVYITIPSFTSSPLIHLLSSPIDVNRLCPPPSFLPPPSSSPSLTSSRAFYSHSHFDIVWISAFKPRRFLLHHDFTRPFFLCLDLHPSFLPSGLLLDPLLPVSLFCKHPQTGAPSPSLSLSISAAPAAAAGPHTHATPEDESDDNEDQDHDQDDFFRLPRMMMMKSAASSLRRMWMWMSPASTSQAPPSSTSSSTSRAPPPPHPRSYRALALLRVDSPEFTELVEAYAGLMRELLVSGFIIARRSFPPSSLFLSPSFHVDRSLTRFLTDELRPADHARTTCVRAQQAVYVGGVLAADGGCVCGGGGGSCPVPRRWSGEEEGGGCLGKRERGKSDLGGKGKKALGDAEAQIVGGGLRGEEGGGDDEDDKVHDEDREEEGEEDGERELVPLLDKSSGTSFLPLSSHSAPAYTPLGFSPPPLRDPLLDVIVVVHVVVGATLSHAAFMVPTREDLAGLVWGRERRRS
ncbi:hypothetical protein R3P38DRAFT_3596097 [Favolaschia claudopus]|uniref:Uncharacterized protein n=1 Tax=Favolaschia claudopus TaxID=2862362 RepID=A0AAW0DM90_9AGAR